MNVYGTEQIRNVVLLGHGGAGKTTVAEAMALITGVTKRMGKVADGNTISDYDKEEIKGLGWIIPCGTTAPGNVCPCPPVPIKGLTKTL